jgi:hypothetical protein
MPHRFRALLALLGVFVAFGGALGVCLALRLDGWPLARGIGGGLIASVIGIRVVVLAHSQRWPAPLRSLLGDDDAV